MADRLRYVGTWLSLVEHSLGVRGVGSSNLPVPTNKSCDPSPANAERDFACELPLTEATHPILLPPRRDQDFASRLKFESGRPDR